MAFQRDLDQARIRRQQAQKDHDILTHETRQIIESVERLSHLAEHQAKGSFGGIWVRGHGGPPNISSAARSSRVSQSWWGSTTKSLSWWGNQAMGRRVPSQEMGWERPEP